MKVRSCFAGLADGLRADLVEGSEYRELFDYHRGRIAALFASQPDLPLHQDTVAGFLHGFLVTGVHFVPAGSLEQESMFPVLGGALLLGRDLPIDADLAAATAGRGFVERAAATLADPDLGGAALGLVREAFVMAADVPMTCASLGGFCLGVLYAAPYLPERGPDPAPLIAAACQLARDLT
jgi:hypothetical protein